MSNEIIKQIKDYLVAAEVEKREVVKLNTTIKPNLNV